jgi:hypothetical protein
MFHIKNGSKSPKSGIKGQYDKLEIRISKPVLSELEWILNKFKI